MIVKIIKAYEIIDEELKREKKSVPQIVVGDVILGIDEG